MAFNKLDSLQEEKNFKSKIKTLQQLISFFLSKNFLTNKSNFSLLLAYLQDSFIKILLQNIQNYD